MNYPTDTLPLKTLGMNIKTRRNGLGLSQEELARLCEMDRTYISLVERGKRNISFINLLKITKALDSDLFTLTKDI